MSIRKCLDILRTANNKFASAYVDPEENPDGKSEFVAVVEPGSQEALAEIDGIVPDGDTWDIADNEKRLINAIKNDPTKTTEEKILSVYDYVCEKYTYDDNLNYYITKNENGEYGVGDWYGRVPSEEWKENRKTHNKRVCYEIARITAGSLKELLSDKEDETCILWDKENIHYFVGLKGNDYTVILDPDNFNQVKDLTRVKLGLTATGIKILDDPNSTFGKALEKYNSDKTEKLPEIKEINPNISDEEYINEALNVLRKKEIDAHGFYEVAKRIVKGRGIPTKNLWKLIGNKRYERCLFFIMPEEQKPGNMRDDDSSKACIIDSQTRELLNIEDVGQIDRRVYISQRGGGPVNTYKGDIEEER